jgi:hypothetical protein
MHPMAARPNNLRDWQHLFGLMLTELFFAAEFERELSVQQRLLDLVVLRQRRWTSRARQSNGVECTS